ncbi:uncharacterized protein [Sinocyclocheilus grahami]|uniref:uncharacterized protein n=1 Tax=Sinocyclocheilus grahami TaxID=75366 RepID=UPI0007ACBE5E|nr:PREDICTED: uncharacterized protein LOC107598008 [Sinocyclocheilus grahami]
MSRTKNSEGNVLKRVAKLPLISSALQQASSVYMGVKGRYPLLGFVGGVAELGVRSASTAALKQAAPLLQNLEPEIEAVNRFALVGLEQLEKFFPILQQPTDEVGLMQLMAMVESLLQLLLSFYTSQVHRVEELRSLLEAQLMSGIQALKVLPPVQQILALPIQVRTIMNDLLELGQILIQLLINTTPLYDLVKQVSDLDAANNPISGELPESPSSRASANSLFLKAMDGRPRRRRSLYARSRRGSASGLPSSPALSPTPTPVPNGRKGSLKLDSQPSGTPEIDTLAVPTTDMIRRRSSATEVLLAPIMQLVTQSQRAFEFLSSGPSSEDQVIPVVETTEH